MQNFQARETDKLRAIAHYEEISPDYDRHIARGPLKFLRDREQNAVLVLAAFDEPKRKTAIDVGCGGGFYARAAKRAGMHVSAVDLSPGMIERMKGTTDAAWVGDVEQPIATTTFDLVICSGVLDFVLAPAVAFANLAAITSAGGRLVVQAPRDGIGSWLYRIEKKIQRIDVNLFSQAWFEGEAARWGLTVVGCSEPLPWNRVLAFERLPN